MCGSLWICQAVTGYSIDFDSEPPMQCTGPTYYRTKKEEEALDREIAELIAKKAVEEVDFCQARFVSPMFIVPKKRGKWRLVLNLQSLNQYVSRVHFKLEDIRSLKDILRQGDFMANWTSKKPISGFQWLIKAGVSCSSTGRTSFSSPPAFPLDSAVPCWSSQTALPSSSLREKTGSPLLHVHRRYVDPRRHQQGAEPQFPSCQSLMTSLGFVVNSEKSMQVPLKR